MTVDGAWCEMRTRFCGMQAVVDKRAFRVAVRNGPGGSNFDAANDGTQLSTMSCGRWIPGQSDENSSEPCEFLYFFRAMTTVNLLACQGTPSSTHSDSCRQPG